MPGPSVVLIGGSTFEARSAREPLRFAGEAADEVKGNA
jgi:hypothetical protein